MSTTPAVMMCHQPNAITLSSRRNLSTDSQATMYGPPGRRHQVVLLDSQAAEDQYIFTSLRYDPCAKPCKSNPDCGKDARATYLFKYHFDRLKDSAGCRGWYDAQKTLKRPSDLHNRLVHAVDTYRQKNNNVKGPFKVRIKLRYHGNIDIDVSPDMSPHKKPLLYPTTLELFGHKHEAASRSSVFKIVLDALPTGKSLHTRSKTEWRSMYDYARVSAGIQSFQDAKEVLLFNAEGEIMDCSITTPYFFRNGGWVTPNTSSGGQTGVTRRWAIDQGLCTFGTIHVDSLRQDEVIWLSNAVKGFFTARFVASPDRCKAPSFRSNSTSVSSSASTAVDSPMPEKIKSVPYQLQPMTESEDWEDLSPHSTREDPDSPAHSPLFGPPGHKLIHSMSDIHLMPMKSGGKPLFRMPQFLAPSPRRAQVSPPQSPGFSKVGAERSMFTIDALSYSHATS